MTDSHYLSCRVAGADDKAARKCVLVNNKRVIPGGFERVIDPGKDSFPVVGNGRSFSMEKIIRSGDIAAESHRDCLMAQTDAQDRYLSGEVLYDLNRISRLLRSPWTRRDDNP